MRFRLQLAGIPLDEAEQDPLFGDDPVWAAHQAVMAKARREAEARMN